MNIQYFRDFYEKLLSSPIKVDELNEKHFPDYTYFDKLLSRNSIESEKYKSSDDIPEYLLFNDYILNNSPYSYINSRCHMIEYIPLPTATNEAVKLSVNHQDAGEVIRKRIYHTQKGGSYELEEKFIFDKDCMFATDVILEDNAQLWIAADMSKIKTFQSSINYFFILNRESKLNFYMLGLGSGNLFINIYTIVNGMGAQAHIKGCFLNKGNDDTVIISYVSHRAPKNTSYVHINNVLLDKSKNFFLGLIRVGKEGEEIDAFETNKNLLLSSQARTLSIPKLEIENNNLRCSHSSSISSIDENILFYMNSRGIEYKDALKLLARGVLVEPFASNKFDELIEYHLSEALVTYKN